MLSLTCSSKDLFSFKSSIQNRNKTSAGKILLDIIRIYFFVQVLQFHMVEVSIYSASNLLCTSWNIYRDMKDNMLGVEEPKLPSTGYTHMPCVWVYLSQKNTENCTEIQIFFYRNTFAYIIQIFAFSSTTLQGKAVLDCLISKIVIVSMIVDY